MVPVGSVTEKLASALEYPATWGLGAAAASAASTVEVSANLVSIVMLIQRVRVGIQVLSGRHTRIYTAIERPSHGIIRATVTRLYVNDNNHVARTNLML
jgi:hypothetical protein